MYASKNVAAGKKIIIIIIITKEKMLKFAAHAKCLVDDIRVGHGIAASAGTPTLVAISGVHSEDTAISEVHVFRLDEETGFTLWRRMRHLPGDASQPFRFRGSRDYAESGGLAFATVPALARDILFVANNTKQVFVMDISAIDSNGVAPGCIAKGLINVTEADTFMCPDVVAAHESLVAVGTRNLRVFGHRGAAIHLFRWNAADEWWMKTAVVEEKLWYPSCMVFVAFGHGLLLADYDPDGIKVLRSRDGKLLRQVAKLQRSDTCEWSSQWYVVCPLNAENDLCLLATDNRVVGWTPKKPDQQYRVLKDGKSLDGVTITALCRVPDTRVVLVIEGETLFAMAPSGW